MTAQHFLVPTDFSADADYALAYAMTLARKLQAKLTLLHVIEPLVVGSVESMPYPFLRDLEDKITRPWRPITPASQRLDSPVTPPWCTACHFRSSSRQPARPMST